MGQPSSEQAHPDSYITLMKKATTDNQEGMNAGEILALLPVAPVAKKRKTWLKTCQEQWQARSNDWRYAAAVACRAQVQ